jgi:hypothetical protein
MLLVSALESLSKLVGQNERPYVLEQRFGERPCYYAIQRGETKHGFPTASFSPVADINKAAGFRNRWAARLAANSLNSHAGRQALSVTPSKVQVINRAGQAKAVPSVP